MKLLLHTCCAPCSVYVIKYLRDNSIEPTLYWYNPNIHPYTEYKKRKDTLEEYTKSININSIFEDEYGVSEWLHKMQPGQARKPAPTRYAQKR